MQAMRQKDYHVQVNGARLRIWATLQKPKDVRDRNKKLLRLASVVQGHLRYKSMIVEDFKVICWRSSSIVVAGRKVLTLTDGQTVIEGDWYDDKIWDGAKNIEGELMKVPAE